MTRCQQQTGRKEENARKFQSRAKHIIRPLWNQRHSGFVTAFLNIFGRSTAHNQRRAVRRKLPFTYRTFGVRGAQAQSHQGQHAGYSQHLHGRDSRRRGATSFLFSPPSLWLLILPPSPMRPLPSLSFTLRAECVKQFTGSGDKTGSVDQNNQPAVKKKSPYRTAPPWRASSTLADGFCWDGTGEPRTPGPERATSQGGRTQVLLLPFPVVQLSNLRSFSRSRFLRPQFSPPSIYYLPSLPAHSSPPHHPPRRWTE